MQTLHKVKDKLIPEEVIRHILKFIPKNKYRSIAQGNKFLYALVCDFEKNITILNITDETVSY